MVQPVAAQPAAPQRVLIVKPSALGDVVTALPVLRGLRRSFPDAHIAWLVSDACAPLIRHDSDLDEAVLFERRKLGRAWRSPAAAAALCKLLRTLRAGRFDWVLDLQGLLRSGLLTRVTGAPLRAGFADAREGAASFYTHRLPVEQAHTVERNVALASMLGVDTRGEDMTLQISPDAGRSAAKMLDDAGLAPGEFIAALPPTTWATKLYPTRHWRAVAAAMGARLPVVLLGAPREAPLCASVAEGIPHVVNLAGRTGVGEMPAVIAASAGVICCDSAAKFIAPAVGVDCVVLIGPTRVERTGPYLRGRAVVADVPCQGCLKKRCSHVTCMQSIAPGEVISAATAMLDRREG